MEEIVKCPVCLDTFEDPRVLPCQHSFCNKCITGIAKSRRGHVVCPQCRKEILAPQNGANEFPSNIFIRNVIDLMNDGSLMTKEQHCASCASNARASHRCLFCGDLLCVLCSQNHQSNLEGLSEETRQRHQVFELALIPSVLQATRIRNYSKCPKHPDEDLKYHCDRCQVTVCRDCTVLKHRDHNVQLLKDALKEYCSAVKSTLGDAREKTSRLDPRLAKINENSTNVENSCGLCFTAIKEAKKKCLEEITIALDLREHELLSELKSLFEQEEVYLQEDRERVESNLSALANSSQYIEEKVNKIGQGSFIETKWKLSNTLENVIEALDHIIEQNNDYGDEGKIELLFRDTGLSDVVKEELTNCMGSIHVVLRNGQNCQRLSSQRKKASGTADATTSSDGQNSDGGNANPNPVPAENTQGSASGGAATANSSHASQQRDPRNRSHRSGRGGGDLNRDITRRRLHCYTCGRTNHKARNCRARYDTLGRQIHRGDTCFKCGYDGHWAEDCLEDSSSDDCSWHTVDEDTGDEVTDRYHANPCCTRCGHDGHHVANCFARYNVDGRRL